MGDIHDSVLIICDVSKGGGGSEIGMCNNVNNLGDTSFSVL